jgi:hypothetical protein
MKKMVHPPLLTQKLWRTLTWDKDISLKMIYLLMKQMLPTLKAMNGHIFGFDSFLPMS